LRVVPVIDGDRSFVEWWATFDCAPEQEEHLTSHFTHQGFAVWLGSLREHLVGRQACEAGAASA
jgi:hypothetical protein